MDQANLLKLIIEYIGAVKSPPPKFIIVDDAIVHTDQISSIYKIEENKIEIKLKQVVNFNSVDTNMKVYTNYKDSQSRDKAFDDIIELLQAVSLW